MIRVAVVGAGHWGPNLIRNFHNHQTSRVTMVVDRDQQRLVQVQQRFPDIMVEQDATHVWKSSEVDAVVIATPTSTHHALVRDGLRAGKHILVEKPITTRSDEGEELCALAAQVGRVLMVGHVFCYNTGIQAVRRYIDEGKLGRVFYVSMTRTNLGPIRLDVNAAWDLASHDVSIANYWMRASATAASAYGGTWINPGIEDAVFATLRYPNDVLVHLHASWLNPRKARDIVIVGEQRMLTFDDMNLMEPIRIYDKQVTDERVRPGFIDTFSSFRASVRDGDIIIPKVAMGEPLRSECDHFLECISLGQTPVTGGREGVEVVRVLEAIERSVKNKGAEEAVLP